MSIKPDFVIKAGDLEPEIRSTLTDSDGNVQSLVGYASVTFLLTPIDSSTATVEKVADVVVAASGTVKYEWVDGDTDTAGTYKAEWVTVDGSARPQTFPAEDHIWVVITGGLD